MRSERRYVSPAGSTKLESSFLSCEKDSESIVRKLFVDSKPYNDELKRLLIINTKDCIDDRTNQKYIDKINSCSIAKLIEDGYIRFSPKLKFEENNEVRNYILISFDNFTPNGGNDYYRDCVIEIDIICHTDYWDIGNFRQRPIKIMGYIDGILNQCRLSGLGTLEFLGANQMILNEELSGYCLMYRAVHGDEDNTEVEE